MILLTRTRRIDWPRILADLRIAMRVNDIADALDVSTGAVQSYTDDRCIEPAFWTGSALLVLWAQQTGQSYTEAPTRAVPLPVAAFLRVG